MKKNNFNIAYMNLSRADKLHIELRNQIVYECNISTAIFYNWLKGVTPVPKLAQPIIAKILNKPETELFPI